MVRREVRDIEDRRVDPRTRDRIDVLNLRYQTFAVRMLWALVIVGIFAIVGIAGSAYLLEQHIKDNKNFSLGIQESRLYSLEESCEGTNTEHQAVIKVLAGFGVTAVVLVPHTKPVATSTIFPTEPNCVTSSEQKLNRH